MIIICVIGKAASGKTTVARFVAECTEMPLVEMSDFLKKITGGTERYEMNLNRHVLEAENPDWLWNHVDQALQQYKNTGCVLSGIREPYLLHKVLQRYEDVYVVGVEASPFNRYSRMCARTENGFFSVHDFRLSEDGTLEDGFVGDNTLGIDITLSRCEKIFNADGSVHSMQNEIQKYLFDSGILSRKFDRAKALRVTK